MLSLLPIALALLLQPCQGRGADPKELKELGEKAIADKPADPRGYVLRGQGYSLTGEPAKAVADFTKALELKPDVAEVLSLRGGELFKVGKVKESVEDFDKQIKLAPRSAEDHWRRGISLYYLDRFDDGAAQFKLGEKVYGNDVENAFWHYLCLAKKDGVAKARPQLLKIGADGRFYMPKVYDLISGKAKPEDVLDAADRGNDREKNEGLFYANLYVGLNYEAEGKADKAMEHLKEALKHKVDHYMWNVADVHVKLREKK